MHKNYVISSVSFVLSEGEQLEKKTHVYQYTGSVHLALNWQQYIVYL